MTWIKPQNVPRTRSFWTRMGAVLNGCRKPDVAKCAGVPNPTRHFCNAWSEAPGAAANRGIAVNGCLHDDENKLPSHTPGLSRAYQERIMQVRTPVARLR